MNQETNKAVDALPAFASLVAALSRPEAFPEAAGPPIVACIQTHASVVLLADERVYKLKKPKNFGFFDYRTPQQRRHFCLEEVRLNARLAPRIYLGVAPVLASAASEPRFGPIFSGEELPEPGELVGGESVIDYAVVMVRLPDEATLEALLRRNEINSPLLSAIAGRIADFHRSTPTSSHISAYGELETIRGNWEENFEQMRPYIGRALDTQTFDTISSYAHTFMERRERLFAARIREGHIRDCHGDLRLQHIYCRLDQERSPADDRSSSPDRDSTHSTIDIIDCIEFNERFRYSDVASEVAFLSMELDEAGRADLAQEFRRAYVAASGDEALSELLPFYCCYRACVRGKVLAFQLDEAEVPPPQKEAARRQAETLFRLAAHYAGSPTVPVLLMVAGVMGTGKSTLAVGLSLALGWKVVASDVIRKRLAGAELTEAHADDFGAGLYTAGWTARTYAALLAEADGVLADARSIILDASFSTRTERRSASALARRLEAVPLLVECRCSREVALQRLALRWRARTQVPQSGGLQLLPSGPTAEAASDGRPELYDAQAATWQPVRSSEDIPYLVIQTDGSAEQTLRELLKALAEGMPGSLLPDRSR
jgi:uncharacterized protein